jgi:hypothetical protein
MVNVLEACADAIMKFEGWTPGSLSYRNRNPGNLEDGHGHYRVFGSLPEGYAELLGDLRDKFLGHTKTGLGPDSTILELFMKYAPPSDNNPTEAYTSFVCGWMSKALGITVVPTTTLGVLWNG